MPSLLLFLFVDPQALGSLRLEFSINAPGSTKRFWKIVSGLVFDCPRGLGAFVVLYLRTVKAIAYTSTTRPKVTTIKVEMIMMGLVKIRTERDPEIVARAAVDRPQELRFLTVPFPIALDIYSGAIGEPET